MERFDHYQHEVQRTGSAVPDGDESRFAKELSLCGMGLAGEAGEVCDTLKKVVHHGRALDRAKVVEEMGDVLWYLAHLANVLGVTLDDVAQANIVKLRKRYPNGFTTADSIARRDEEPAR